MRTDMRGQTPTLHCDAYDGCCGNWDVDYYQATASTVNGVRITQQERAPGWKNSADEDLCPDHLVKDD
jgi:hypothetical protein